MRAVPKQTHTRLESRVKLIIYPYSLHSKQLIPQRDNGTYIYNWWTGIEDAIPIFSAQNNEKYKNWLESQKQEESYKKTIFTVEHCKFWIWPKKIC